VIVMSSDIAQPRSRRALLAGAAAGLGALAATAFGRPATARAGEPSVTLGGDNTTASPTIVRNDTADSRAIIAVADAGIGMHGTGGKAGVLGTSEAGFAVWGDSPTGSGVHGSGKVGGLFTARPGGYAIHVDGKARFSRSGKLEVAAGSEQVRSGRVDLNPSSLVLVTLQGRQKGVWVEGVVPDYTGESFTVFLNKASPKAVTLAWFVVN
jgi:hypothetical protein